MRCVGVDGQDLVPIDAGAVWPGAGVGRDSRQFELECGYTVEVVVWEEQQTQKEERADREDSDAPASDSRHHPYAWRKVVGLSTACTREG